ncbi:MAG: hypothetical protein K2F99_07405, partial [Muribaculaceae bacterium]|nr:hypothetical protein [Muribaculaceae bacterium]
SFYLRILNTLSTFASAAIASTLWNYLGYIHVPDDERKYIKMKNEFYYSRIVVTFAMKSYIALLKRREEVVLKTPELDVKGVNFFKSTASKQTSEFIYKDILMGQIFDSEDGNLSLKRTYKAIQDFQKNIKSEIREGNVGFLKQSVKVKSADAYANPMRIGQYKATYVWNEVVSDQERITYPAIVTLAKVKLQTKKDAAALAPWPNVYNKIIEMFETNPEIGDHMEWVKDKNGNMKEKLVKGKGIKAIAFPSDLEQVPDWILPIIDVETLVSDNMALMDQIMKPLGMTPGTASSRGSNFKMYSSIVRI